MKIYCFCIVMTMIFIYGPSTWLGYNSSWICPGPRCLYYYFHRATGPGLVFVASYVNGNERNLTHWGRVTHLCVSELTIIGSDNGLSPGRRQAIIWTNAVILLIEPLGTNFSEILIEIQIFSFKKMRLKMSSAKWRPFCLGLNVLS